MKRISLKLILLFVTVLFSNCKKEFLDTVPTSSTDEATIFATTTNTKNVMNGIYRYMYTKYSTQNQPGHGGMMLQLDFMGEDIGLAVQSWYTNAANGAANWIEMRNESDIWVEFPFRFYYRVVGNANRIIDNVDAAEGPDAEKRMLKAEALTVRAWAYHNLVRLFAKRYDKASKPNNQLGVSMPLSATQINLPRSSVEAVYTQINLDLDNAIDLFNGATLAENKSHISIDAARAVKANVALTMQEYEVAATFAQAVITNNKYSLMTEAQYQSGFNDISNPEWIWGVYLQADQGDTFANYHAQISLDGNTTFIRDRPKRINSALYALIPSTDVRKKMWEPTPTAANFPLPAANFKRENYMSRKFKVKTANTTLGDVPYIRLAEVYLTLAEALANIPGREVEARQKLYDLNRTRNASYALSTNSGAALIEEILVYRRVELWGEGHRFYDLKRLNRGLDRRTAPNFVAASVGDVMVIPAGDPRWQWVIPRAEIQANTNTKQND
ncbi:RagB/SusD family nutrient uptake outer membrane protein [Pedobacter xixiisoli]|uniref:SusD family protein n=1 Tax=Pedobacter xixiisoli TaxID=1476464 RepID=A0A286ADS0_9SPHI|nr:RagB/SusD family nutrient uptake outer membrane protein [Pedobacter xixiisoli]SOD20052.1 SusD family protein [Pedobacter xixiisoli]